MSAPANLARLIPTGTSRYGCGQEATIGVFPAQGHDKCAEDALLACLFDQQVPQVLHHFGPGRPVNDEAVESGAWESCPAPTCPYPATPGSMRRHLAKAGH